MVALRSLNLDTYYMPIFGHDLKCPWKNVNDENFMESKLFLCNCRNTKWSLLDSFKYIEICLPGVSGGTLSVLIVGAFLQEQNVEIFEANGIDPLIVSLYQMDLDRTQFLLRSYLRVRLQKVAASSYGLLWMFGYSVEI